MKYILLLIIIAMLGSCYYDKEELLYGTTPCDTANVKYSVQILDILQSSCLGCHGGSAASGGGIQLGTYAGVKAAVDNGSLFNAVTRTVNTMPKGAPKLAACRISEIRIWIQKGAPNN